jgi:hypothetical protein
MSHNISGLVAKPDQLDRLGGALAAQPRQPLGQGFAFVPLDFHNLDQIAGADGPAMAKFEYLGEGLIGLLCASGAELAYVETNYFGGAGWQGAVVCAAGEVMFGPTWGKFGPINDALGLLGVRRLPGRSADEFDCVGLGGFRDNDDARPGAGPRDEDGD